MVKYSEDDMEGAMESILDKIATARKAINDKKYEKATFYLDLLEAHTHKVFYDLVGEDLDVDVAEELERLEEEKKKYEA